MQSQPFDFREKKSSGQPSFDSRKKKKEEEKDRLLPLRNCYVYQCFSHQRFLSHTDSRGNMIGRRRENPDVQLTPLTCQVGHAVIVDLHQGCQAGKRNIRLNTEDKLFV